jgi:hypothetical protein
MQVQPITHHKHNLHVLPLQILLLQIKNNQTQIEKQQR